MIDSIPAPALEPVIIALLVLTSLIVVLRLASAAIKHRKLVPEDIWLFLSYFLSVICGIIYIDLLKVYFRATGSANNPDHDAASDAALMKTWVFATSILYWSCLWSAKLSLLCLYKKLLFQLPIYLRLWWGLVGLCALTYICCLITLLLSCSKMEQWFTAMACATPRDIVAISVSRYFGYGVDTLTNILIMLLPLRLLFLVQMPLGRKIRISSLFCLGWICVIAATFRATQIGERDAQPSIPWLAFWSILETSVACVACSGPGLYGAFASYSTTRRPKRRDTERSPWRGGHYVLQEVKNAGLRWAPRNLRPAVIREHRVSLNSNRSEENLMHSLRLQAAQQSPEPRMETRSKTSIV